MFFFFKESATTEFYPYVPTRSLHDPLPILSVDGHTDNTGDVDHNLALSKARAAAVVDAIVDQGIDGSRLLSEGFGQARPIADNDTEAGRASNRRVERSEEHTSELQSLMRISYAVFCLKKKT